MALQTGGRKKKGPVPPEPEQDLNTTKCATNSQADNSTSEDISAISILDNKKGRHYWFVVYPTEKWIRENAPDCKYDGRDGWGTAPYDWIEQLRQTGLAFCVSCLHDSDVNPDGRVKKPHWHVIVSWGGPTTFRSARGLCDMLHCPLPQMLVNPTGAYRYMQHLDNPEKHQYAEKPKAYNGWERPLEKAEVEQLKTEIRHIMYYEDCIEYDELLEVLETYGPEYVDVANNNSIFCNQILKGYRMHPVRGLLRYYLKLADDAPEKNVIKSRLRQHEYDPDQIKRESGDNAKWAAMELARKHDNDVKHKW